MANLDFTVFANTIKDGRPIEAIKMIRDEYHLPLITCKCLMEIIRIIEGDVECSKCHTIIDQEKIGIPRTLQTRMDDRGNRLPE